MSEMAFEGFSAEGLQFLDELGQADKAWFDKHRATYDAQVVAPTRAFVVALGERLADEISPTIVARPKTNQSISPINNDRRFSPDKSSYKDHLLLRFWDGADKKTAPTLMVRIANDEVGFASGTAIPDVQRWRDLVDDDTTGQALVDALAQLDNISRLDIAGQQLKRVPKPYTEDHPRAQLLQYKGTLQARWPEQTPASIHTAEFVDHCADRLSRLSALHHWFVQSLS